jgi:hypothetical protein
MRCERQGNGSSAALSVGGSRIGDQLLESANAINNAAIHHRNLSVGALLIR